MVALMYAVDFVTSRWRRFGTVLTVWPRNDSLKIYVTANGGSDKSTKQSDSKIAAPIATTLYATDAGGVGKWPDPLWIGSGHRGHNRQRRHRPLHRFHSEQISRNDFAIGRDVRRCLETPTKTCHDAPHFLFTPLHLILPIDPPHNDHRFIRSSLGGAIITTVARSSDRKENAEHLVIARIRWMSQSLVGDIGFDDCWFERRITFVYLSVCWPVMRLRGLPPLLLWLSKTVTWLL